MDTLAVFFFLEPKACEKVRVHMVHMCLATESQQVNLALHSVLINELLKEKKLLKFKTMLRLAYFESEWNVYFKDALDSALLGLPTRKHYQLVYCLLTSLSKITLRQWQNMTLYLLFSASGFGYPQNFLQTSRIGITCLHSLLKNTFFFKLKCDEVSSSVYTAEHKLPKTRINFKTGFPFFTFHIFCSDVTGWWMPRWQCCTMKKEADRLVMPSARRPGKSGALQSLAHLTPSFFFSFLSVCSITSSVLGQKQCLNYFARSVETSS